MKTQTFVRKSFEIEAVQVTEENFYKVSDWCGGTVFDDGESPYIKVRVHHPITPRQTQAFVGDWVLASRKGYKVYTDEAFRSNFVNASDELVELRTNDSTPVDAQNVFEMARQLEEVLNIAVSEKNSIGGKR